MPDFSQRSRTEELLDQVDLDQQDLFQNLTELDSINRLLGGHQATLKGLKRLMVDPNKTYRITDYACGGGDTLRAISKWAKAKKIRVELGGFDLLPDAILYAKKHSEEYPIKYEIADFKNFKSTNCDIAICSLVCHHFYDNKLDSFIKKMIETAQVAIIINDLHRHAFAYHSIAILTRFFSKSRLVKNDAKLSVLKGFTKQDWHKILTRISPSSFSIEWVWAFRHLIMISK